MVKGMLVCALLSVCIRVEHAYQNVRAAEETGGFVGLDFTA